MAYAHTNIEIKPVDGVDFQPAPFVIANAEGATPLATPTERPPSLKPEAAQKLLEVADRLKQALESSSDPKAEAALTPEPAAPAAQSL